MNKLVIVESPTKARTLARYLGKDYQIESSKGHIRDLPKSSLGVDVEHGFKPSYEILAGKKVIAFRLRREARKADQIILATDLDREGEAISYHIKEVIQENQKPKIRNQKFQRVVFPEITKEAIGEAFTHPRSLDIDLFNAYQARRILDRLVGYQLSPLLWKKIRYGLSAGRVQSVALRLIVERESEREQFDKERYFSLEAELAKEPEREKKESFVATLFSKNKRPYEVTRKFVLFAGEYHSRKTSIDSQRMADRLVQEIGTYPFFVDQVDQKETRVSPLPPFTTATLQREAVNRLGFTAQRTMRAAQALYEKGLITYHRTDSVRLSPEFLHKCRDYVKKHFGQQFIPKSARHYQTSAKSAQEAHEAVRPSKFVKDGVGLDSRVEGRLGDDEVKLYQLIFKRTVACQMSAAVFDQVRVDITAGPYQFRASGRVLKFEGFLRVMEIGKDEMLGDSPVTFLGRGGGDKPLQALVKGEKLRLVGLTPTEHQTQPPPRYTEASLIRDFEKHGIGRPSTYAPILSTIQARNYVVKEGKYFRPEEVGLVVNDLLRVHFNEIVDIGFTAKMEDNLDGIASGSKDWVRMVGEFYQPFIQKMKKKMVELKKEDFTVTRKLSEECPNCSKPLVIKLSRFGKFVSCSGFPLCKYARPFVEEVGVSCSECHRGQIVIRRTKRGRRFYGCSRYPECKFASWKKPKSEEGEEMMSFTDG